MQKLRCTQRSPVLPSVAHGGPGAQAQWHPFRSGLLSRCPQKHWWMNARGSEGVNGDRGGCWRMVEGGPRSLGETGPGHPVSQRALEEAGETGKTLERWKRTAEELCVRQAGGGHLLSGCRAGVALPEVSDLSRSRHIGPPPAATWTRSPTPPGSPPLPRPRSSLALQPQRVAVEAGWTASGQRRRKGPSHLPSAPPGQQVTQWRSFCFPTF